MRSDFSLDKSKPVRNMYALRGLGEIKQAEGVPCFLPTDPINLTK